jgi:hypothetical protein|tara:strand:- start:383 stop:628 length:246 start_codon:yes stop_codon:yes gene_type:complete
MTSKYNEITGKKMVSGRNTDKYRFNWDVIFASKVDVTDVDKIDEEFAKLTEVVTNEEIDEAFTLDADDAEVIATYGNIIKE